MKRVFITLICCMALLSASKSENIRFKTGYLIENVKVVDTVGTTITCTTNDAGYHRTLHILKDRISKIEIAPYVLTLPTKYNGKVLPDESFQKIWDESEGSDTPSADITREPTLPHLDMLLLTAVSAALSYDYFSQASDIDDLIGATEKMQSLQTNKAWKDAYSAQIDSYKTQKTRKMIVGGVSAAVGIISAIVALYPAEITVSPSSVKLSYRF